MSAVLGHAVIGCGRVAPRHVAALRASGVDVLWACARRRAQAEDFAGRHGIPYATDRVTDVFDDPRVGSVSITVPHALHAGLAVAALRAGRHVLVEKPLAVSIADARRVAELAADSGLIVSVVSQYRYDPLVIGMRQWLADGLLGTLRCGHVHLECRRTPEYYADSEWRGTWCGEGGSTLINQGYHLVDVLRFLCGQPVVRAAAIGPGPLSDVMETDQAVGALLTVAGAPVTLAMTVGGSGDWRSRLHLAGDGGTVEFDLDGPATLRHCAGNPELRRRADEFRRPATVTGRQYYRTAHRAQTMAFVRAVRAGSGVPTDAADALRTLTLIGDIYRAAGTRSPLAEVNP